MSEYTKYLQKPTARQGLVDAMAEKVLKMCAEEHLTKYEIYSVADAMMQGSWHSELPTLK